MINIEQYDSIFGSGGVIYWRIKNNGDSIVHQNVLPAFYFDLIIPLKGRIFVDDKWLSEPFVSPILKENKDVTLEPNTELEGYRFSPLFFYLMTAIDPCHLKQTYNILYDLKGVQFLNELLANLKKLKDLKYDSNVHLSIIDRFEKRMYQHQKSLILLSQVVGHLLLDEDSVSEIARQQGISLRWIQKLFKRFFNLSPHELIQLIRFNESLLMIMNQRKVSLTNVSYSAHFYDQPHFIRTFKQFSGLLPSQFAKENHMFYKLMNQLEENDFSNNPSTLQNSTFSKV